MPLTLAKLTANKASVAIPFGDDPTDPNNTLNIEYYPGKLTGKMMADITTLSALDPAALQTMPQAQALDTVVKLTSSPADMLKALLCGWDLCESIAEDGTPINPVPCTPEQIDALGYVNQWILLNGLMQSVGDAQGKSSAPVANGSPNAQPSGAIS